MMVILGIMVGAMVILMIWGSEKLTDKMSELEYKIESLDTKLLLLDNEDEKRRYE